MKLLTRVLAALIAALMAGGVLFQIIGGLWASAAEVYNITVTRGDNEVDYIGNGHTVTIKFTTVIEVAAGSPAPQLSPNEDDKKPYTTNKFEVNRDVWRTVSSSSTNLKIEFLEEDDAAKNTYLADITVTNVTYRNSNKIGLLEISPPSGGGNISLSPANGNAVEIPLFSVDLDSSLFERSSGGGTSTGDEDETYVSDIVVESVLAKDEKGKVLTEITKDTPPFSIEIVYTDRGLWDVSTDEFSSENTMYVYITDAGPFSLRSTAKGTLRPVSIVPGDPPRFRATFNDVTYSGGMANYGEIEFRVNYDIYGYDVKGVGEARLYSVVPDKDDAADIAPPTPYIIINQYDLGKAQIEAGSTFTLAMDFKNTSKELAVENIRVIVNPVTTGTTEMSFLSIASATNTYYYENLDAGASLSQNVDILVKGTATVGSQALSVEFFYEYVQNKERKLGSTETTIYVPITQIDRFFVDPVTDFSSWMMLGDEGYATISFVNHGKSDTYNISGYLLDADGNQGQTEHFGNLSAGEYGTLDFVLTPSMAGDYNGTIVIIYEDENGEQKEISTTFTSFVEERYFPTPPEDPGSEFPGEMPGAGTPWWRYALFAGGGLAIAAPLALYLAKRVKAKGSEDFDEDF